MEQEGEKKIPSVYRTYINFKNVSQYRGVCVCSGVSASVTPRTVAHQAPLSMGFSRLEYWSGWPLPTPPIYRRCGQILFDSTYIRYLATAF